MKKYLIGFKEAVEEFVVTSIDMFIFSVTVAQVTLEIPSAVAQEAFKPFWKKMWELDQPKKHRTYLDILLGLEEIKKAFEEFIFDSKNELVEWKDEWNPQKPKTYLAGGNAILHEPTTVVQFEPKVKKIDGERFMQTGKNNKNLKVFIYNPRVLRDIEMKD